MGRTICTFGLSQLQQVVLGCDRSRHSFQWDMVPLLELIDAAELDELVSHCQA